MKRALILACAVIAAIALVAGGTFAYFTVEDTARNAITTGSVSFEIVELTDGNKAFPISGVTVMPGDSVTKIVSAKNTGDHPIFVRIKLTKGIENSQLPVNDQLKVDINTTDWTYKDGYYYYNKELKAGEESKPLFTKVDVDGPSVDNKYIGKTFFLKVDGDAVQSENNSTDVLKALGWPEDN